MPRTSAGLLLYRKTDRGLEVLLAHPGGPFFAQKEDGMWGIPKGEINPDENLFAAAKREFEEETGLRPEGNFIELGSITQAGGKIVHAWAIEGDCAPEKLCSNTFTIEWPPQSGQQKESPEVDRFGFFTFAEAKTKIKPAQYELLERLAQKLNR